MADDPKPVDDPKPADDPKPDVPKDDPAPDDEPVKSDDDWQAKARKHERAAKKERKLREEAEQKAKELADKDKTEQERAIEAAREEGKAQALTEAEKERRSDRLELAVTRLASKGVTVGEGDDAKAVRFADAEDALDKVNRRIRNGDIDSDDIYDSEGKVNTDALTTALADVARDYPHLIGEGERPKPQGDADVRKGDPAQKDLEAMSPEDHAKRKYATK